jgi:regulatory GntR family protein/FCD domain-containing protein
LRPRARGTRVGQSQVPPERELPQQFGASQTAVREALGILEIAGLLGLQNGGKGGAFILEGTPRLSESLQDMASLGRISLNDLTEARLLIQEVIVGLACARAAEADFAAMEADIDRVDELTRAGRLRERLDYSVRFYPILLSATGWSREGADGVLPLHGVVGSRHRGGGGASSHPVGPACAQIRYRVQLTYATVRHAILRRLPGPRPSIGLLRRHRPAGPSR